MASSISLNELTAASEGLSVPTGDVLFTGGTRHASLIIPSGSENSWIASEDEKTWIASGSENSWIASEDEKTWIASGSNTWMIVMGTHYGRLIFTLIQPTTTVTVGFDAFEIERKAFLRMKEQLLSSISYRGKFVAILNGSVIDSDCDKVQLAKRVYEKHGYVPMYIDKVEKKRKVVEIPSPEISRK